MQVFTSLVPNNIIRIEPEAMLTVQIHYRYNDSEQLKYLECLVIKPK
jgi:hypothetical protein